MLRLPLLFIIFLLICPTALRAQDELNACPYDGQWTLYYAIGFRYGSTVVPGFADWTEYATFEIQISCDGANTTFEGDGTGRIEVENNLGPVCSGDFQAAINGTVTETSENYPVFTVNFAPLTYVSGDCGAGGNRTLTLYTNELLVTDQFQEYQGDLITGFVLADTIPAEEVIVDVYVVAAQRRYQPEVLNVEPQYVRYIVRDVPLTNRYTFEIDWDGAPEPAADISVLGGDWETLIVSGDEATYLLSVTSLPLTAADFASTKLIDVTMDMRFPIMETPSFSVSPDQIRTTIVDLPSWAVASDFFL